MPKKLLPFVRKAPPKAPANAGLGKLTRCDLGAVTNLWAPIAIDPFGRLRPPISHDIAAFALELAATAYTLDIDPWKAAGWDDFAVLIDDSLESGLSEQGPKLARMETGIRLWRAKAALDDRSPLSQVRGALRQKDKSDTVKALCMLRPMGGTFLVALGFMGTGKRVYDWFSNLRFLPREGWHDGFLQLCESFESRMGDMKFPNAAKALGVDTLTLADILRDMKRTNSRFRLFMAGHSQGGAVMQVFARRCMENGVLWQNLRGYGFASPTAATGENVQDAADAPLVHFVNKADIVPRVGSLMHLGLCVEAPLPPPTHEDALTQQAAQWLNGICDTPDCLVHLAALLQCAAEEKGIESLSELLGSRWLPSAMDRVLLKAGDKAIDLLDRAMATLREQYEALTGKPMDEQALTALREQCRPTIRQTPMRTLLAALGKAFRTPHKLSNDAGDAPYTRMVVDKWDDFQPFLWQMREGQMPTRRYATAGEMHWEAACLPNPQRPERGERRLRGLGQGKLRLAYSQQRAARR